jgi:hypothetical protein
LIRGSVAKKLAELLRISFKPGSSHCKHVTIVRSEVAFIKDGGGQASLDLE